MVSSVERERCSRCSADVHNEDHELRLSTDTRTEVGGSSQDVGLTRNRVRGLSVFFSCEERDSLRSHGDVASIGCATRCQSVLPAKGRSDAQADWLLYRQ